MDMTLDQKQALEVLVEQDSKQVATVAYNPSTVAGTPEVDVLAAGWAEYQRQGSANLTEVVYTK